MGLFDKVMASIVTVICLAMAALMFYVAWTPPRRFSRRDIIDRVILMVLTAIFIVIAILAILCGFGAIC